MFWANVSLFFFISPLWYSMVPFSVPSCTLSVGALIVYQWQAMTSHCWMKLLMSTPEKTCTFPHVQKGCVLPFLQLTWAPADARAKRQTTQHGFWKVKLIIYIFFNLLVFILCHVTNNTGWFLFLISDFFLDCIPLTFPQRFYFLNLWRILLPSCWCFSFIGGE